MQRLLLLFMLVLAACGDSGQKERSRMRIGIVVLGDAEEGHVQAVREAIDSFYKSRTVVLRRHDLPAMAWYEPRKRYKADSLLEYLVSIKPDSIDKIAGITTSDISTSTNEHKDWGIFGLATISGRSCVISSFRLHAGKAAPDKVKERIQKVALHELGHNFGLEHCSSGSKTCLLRDAKGKMKTVDEERMMLCEKCSALLD